MVVLDYINLHAQCIICIKDVLIKSHWLDLKQNVLSVMLQMCKSKYLFITT